MDKLVQHIKMDMSGFPKQGLYCYGEASFEAKKRLVIPLALVDVWDLYGEYINRKWGDK